MTDRDDKGNVTDLQVIGTLLRTARIQPEPQRIKTMDAVIEVIDALCAADPPEATRQHLRLIQGQLGALGVAAAALGHRALGQPAAAVVAAGTVAVAGTAGAVIYISGEPHDQQPAASTQTSRPVQPTIPRHPRSPMRSVPSQRSHQPGPVPSAALAMSSSPNSPGAAQVSSSAAPDRLSASRPRPVISTVPVELPPMSPSPSDQHMTCLRLRLRPVGTDLGLCVA